MTRPPDYVVHQANEKDVTVDWFFGRSRSMRIRRIQQLALMVVGWLFAALPVVITVSALVYRDNPNDGWWSYREGIFMWEVSSATLGFLIAVFVIGYLVLYFINRASARKAAQRKTYDVTRLSRRLELAADMYDTKYGDEALRLGRRKILIEPYQDIETYELRDRYREYGVD